MRSDSFLALLIVAFSSCLASQTAAQERSRLSQDDLLVFHNDKSEVQPVKSIDDWSRRRAEIIRGMESVMGKLPGTEKRVPLDLKVEEEFDGGTYVRRLISYCSEPNCRTPAYLMIPKDVLEGKRKAPAVLCLHGTNMEIGHGSIVGLGTRPNRGYALELTQRGYVTLSPNYPIMAKYHPDLQALGWDSGTLKAVWDNMRGLDLLETLPYVEGKQFAAIGHSLGGHNSVYTAVFDPRIAAVVSSCGLDSYRDYYDGNPANWDPQKGWCQTRYMLKLASYKNQLGKIPFDFSEMIAAIAPRQVLVIAPTRDSNFRADSVDRVAKAASDIYKLYGHPDHLRVLHPDCEHDFPPDMREQAYLLIDSVLKKKD